jgi:2-deoxy-D-gluconate 3-dehydrogenase
VIDVNLNSTWAVTRPIGAAMAERRTGKIITIASLLSFQGGITVPAYTASKHAVAGLTRALANEWGPAGVQVNAIAPGYISTDNTTELRADPAREAAIRQRIPAGRWGRPGGRCRRRGVPGLGGRGLRQRPCPRCRWWLVSQIGVAG